MRKTLLVLGTVVILFAALFRFEFVSADAVGGSRNAGGEPATVSPQPNPVKEGTFTPLQPVQDKKKVKIRGRVLMPNGEVAEGVNWMFAGYGTSDNWKISNGGGPYEPRIDFATLGPEQLKDKETVDLGDILIDSDKAVVEPDAWTVTLFSELADKVKSGEKKSMLKIYVKEEAKDALEYILKHQDEEPLASFALFVVQFEKLTKAGQERFALAFADGETLLIANDPITASSPEGAATLSQLRGEKESKWKDAPKDVPAQDGDWKKSPGMLNPKILDSFLKDILERTSS